MADPENTPGPEFSEQPADPSSAESACEAAPAEPMQVFVAQYPSNELQGAFPDRSSEVASHRRDLRRNLILLFSLTLAAFVLTTWILVRVDAPFGAFLSGPQELVRAQLRALDRGELKPAYDMFSPRYRGQVSFNTWHELCISHWRMFHASVVRADAPAVSGPGVTLEIYLHGADDRDYRARFTLIRADGRWWIDDVHWTEEADERDVTRI